MDERILFWTKWGALGQWFAGAMTLAAVLYALFRDRMQRPKLCATFDKTSDVNDQVNTVGSLAEELRLPPTTPSRWVRIRVTNRPGRGVAKNCRASIIRLERLNPANKPVEVLPNPGRALGWEHLREGKRRDIHAGGFHRVDVLCAVQNTVHVVSSPPWAFTDPGEYLVTVQVLANDADAQDITLHAIWGGNWDTLVVV
jgi:hypothetical protein